MKRKDNCQYKKAQAALEYACLIAILVGTFLGVQAYLKRGMQGQLQAASDQLSEQFAYGLTNEHQHFESFVRSKECRLPAPRMKIEIKPDSHYSGTIERSISPLSAGWLPKGQEPE